MDAASTAKTGSDAAANVSVTDDGTHQSRPVLPRIAISFCTQCKWMLRAAYFGQELLSTFGTAIGEVALIPATGGLFRVELTYNPVEGKIDIDSSNVRSVLLWDRKAEGGFPETKVLKQRVRDHIEPAKDLGHSDKHGKGSVKSTQGSASTNAAMTSEEGVQPAVAAEPKRNPDGTICEDCR